MHHLKAIKCLTVAVPLITIPILINDNNYLKFIPLYYQSESQKLLTLKSNLDLINKKRNENEHIIKNINNIKEIVKINGCLTEQLFFDIFKKKAIDIFNETNKLISLIDILPNNSFFFKHLDSFVPSYMLTNDIYELILSTKNVSIDFIPSHNITFKICSKYISNSNTIKECEERYLYAICRYNYKNCTTGVYIKKLIYFITNNNKDYSSIVNKIFNTDINDFDYNMWTKIIELIPEKIFVTILKNMLNDDANIKHSNGYTLFNDKHICNILSIDGTLLRHINVCYMTQKHIDIAFKENSESSRYFHEKFFTDDMIIKIINKNKLSLYIIPSHLITSDHIILFLKLNMNFTVPNNSDTFNEHFDECFNEAFNKLPPYLKNYNLKIIFKNILKTLQSDGKYPNQYKNFIINLYLNKN